MTSHHVRYVPYLTPLRVQQKTLRVQHDFPACAVKFSACADVFLQKVPGILKDIDFMCAELWGLRVRLRVRSAVL